MGHLDHEHVHAHTHEHTHDGVPHTHAHDHEHSHAHHSHDHAHDHDHHHMHAEGGSVSAQTVALLQYMLDHNIHHAAELNDLAQQLTGEAKHQMLHAVEAFDQANGYLSAALELLK